MEFKEFSKLVIEHFGRKLTSYYLNMDTESVHGILYESFEVEFSIGDRYGQFSAAIWLGASIQGLSRVLGEELSLNSDAESIKQSLGAIDNYCRLRLPDKFLEEFDKLMNT
ncbi:MAG: hypothetical protein ACM3MK_05680 [Chitinophagales bacterium]